MASKTDRLDQLVSVFRKWLYLPDAGIVEIALATVLANRLRGDPVWVLLVGGPSDGKTEILNTLSGLPDCFRASTLTEAALLSGSPKKDRTSGSTGGLLAQVGDFGILVLKDFTSILSTKRDTQPPLLAALREIYDGSWVRPVGTDGGRTLEWQGKLGLVAGVTSAIDTAYSLMSEMGPRFILYRLAETDSVKQGRCALDSLGSESEMRAELLGEVSAFLAEVDVARSPRLPKADEDLLIALAALVVTCRSAVDRNARTREIDLVHSPERPARLVRVLGQLLRGLQLIGVRRSRQRELLLKVGLDCIPIHRRLVLEPLLNSEASMTTAELAHGTNYSVSTIRRALEELACHGVLEHTESHSATRRADTWQVSPFWREQYRTVRGAFPKCG